MTALHFEWDSQKDLANQRRHGIAFPEAETVFLDEAAVLIGDPDHSDDEDRFLLLGLSQRLRILSVAHCYRASECMIRIISARKATRQEQDQYDRRWRK